MLLCIGLTLIVGIILFAAIIRENQADEEHEFTNSVVKELSGLNFSLYEYLLHKEDWSLTQWNLKYNSLAKLLETTAYSRYEENIILDRIRQNHSDIYTYFNQYINNQTEWESTTQEQNELISKLEERITNRILLKSYEIISLANQLQDVCNARVKEINQQTKVIIFVLVIILGVIVSFISLITIRQLIVAIKKLNIGTKIIGTGNLNYKIGPIAKDEIGELALEFDKMTKKLKTIMVSHDKLTQEVTERKQAEKNLLRYKNIVSTSSDYISLIDKSYIYQIVNEAYLKAFNKTKNEIIGHSVENLVGEKHFKEIVRNYLDRCFSGESVRYQSEFDFPDNRKRILDIAYYPFYGESKSVEYAVVIARDITENKFAEQSILLQSEITENMSEGIFLVGADDGIIKYTNPKFEEIFGYVPEEMVGKHISIINAPTDKTPEEIAKEIMEILDKTGEWRGEINNIKKDGTYFWCYASVSVFNHSEYGRVLVAVHNDITKRKKAEEELQKTQRLESVGVLAAGIAHDFNNLLGGIFLCLDMAKRFAAGNKEVITYIDKAFISFHRAKNLTLQLLTFSKGGTPIKKIISIETVLKDSKELSLSGSNIYCDLKISRKLRLIEADEGQLGQVLNNILLNARQSMSNGGVVAITARNRTLKAHQVPNCAEGSYVQITIKDEGTGIPEKLLSKVFDPFFTTKQTGSGLGLATSYSIIRKHKGIITINSTLGSGTTVNIYLPTCVGEEATDKPEKSTPAPMMGGRILVMDDEELIRETVEGMLELFGFETAGARNGEEAIRLFKEYHDSGNSFDLAILDLTIPGGLGGEETIARLRLIDPNILSIVSSGYSDSPILTNPEKYGFSEKIEKPYEMNQLIHTVGEVLKLNSKKSKKGRQS